MPKKTTTADVVYLRTLPTAILKGVVLVHNHVVRPTRRFGWRGFRAWLSAQDRRRLEICSCDWAPELGRHYRVRAATARQTGAQRPKGHDIGHHAHVPPALGQTLASV